jgi:general secretion pathway protein A
MYLSYYGLKEKPFQITADPAFLWLGEKHQEALSTLKYGILENKGFVLLTGEVGTGKTVLINQLVTVLDVDTIVATIPDPDLDSLDFYKLLAAGFGIKKTFMSKGGFLMHLRDFLHQSYADKKQVLLIVDEAQRLNHKLLEEIRLLSNIELHDRKLINIFFVGQTEFKASLMEHQNRAVAQRITVKYDIQPLEQKEVGAFIQHRLKVAGTEKTIFTNDAIEEIYTFAEGIPRLINIICDHALLTGFAYGRKKIDKAIVNECADELYMPIKKELKREVEEAAAEEMVASGGKGATQSSAGVEVAKVSAGSPSEKRIQAAGGVVQVVEAKPAQKTTARSVPGAGASRASKTKATGPGKSAESTEAKPAGKFSKIVRNTVVVLFVGLLVAAIAYFFITMNSPDEPRFAMEDLTPQNFETTLEKERANLQERVDKGDFNENATDQKATDQSPKDEASQEAETPAAEGTQAAAATPPETDNVEADLSLLLEEKLLIFFELNSNDIDPGALGSLDRIAAFMKRHPEHKVLINGYSDSMGASSYNISVSRFRANAVKSYLIGKGALPDNLVVKALGAADPIADNGTAWGRKRNRRVEISFAQAPTNG